MLGFLLLEAAELVFEEHLVVLLQELAVSGQFLLGFLALSHFFGTVEEAIKIYLLSLTILAHVHRHRRLLLELSGVQETRNIVHLEVEVLSRGPRLNLVSAI